MPKYLGALTIVLLLGMVLTRISVLRRQGIKAMKFGNIDKTDFLIPPYALFYFYVLFAAAFHWPTVTTHQFFHSEIIAWTGVLFCLAGLLLFLWSLISFRQSFRVGIDADHPDRLITDGVFAFSRNPICGLCDHLDWRILHLPELDKFDCSGRGRMAAPPSSLARGRTFGQVLRPSLRGVSPPRSKISLNMWRVRLHETALSARTAQYLGPSGDDPCGNLMHGGQAPSSPWPSRKSYGARH